ncbi:hypothetical protein AV926_15075 [Myroides marinus]|uniref:Uncharacterized protein n=1 Tax=Myroides marinus TaxID=703342 RepID=A0A163WRG3_9FLAO|nr:hypothetical protein [Myroides marinus]KZE76730.1 hypothetical protein AV926_15075 [Myroides marinus]
MAIASFNYVNASNEDVVKTSNNVLELPTGLEEVEDDTCYALDFSCFSTIFCENGHSKKEVAESIIFLESTCHE